MHTPHSPKSIRACLARAATHVVSDRLKRKQAVAAKDCRVRSTSRERLQIKTQSQNFVCSANLEIGAG